MSGDGDDLAPVAKAHAEKPPVRIGIETAAHKRLTGESISLAKVRWAEAGA